MRDINKKVILIGLDGATWNLIKPWADSGDLPAFKKMMEEGAWGTLKSTVPPLSPSAWVSIYTGCMPNKHGIFSFMKRKTDSYFYRPISARDINMITIWDILSNIGLRSIIINALFMYPPKPLNGIVITGLGTPSKNSNFTYPKHYSEFIRKKFPKYDVDFNEDLLLVSDNVNDFISKIYDITLEQINLTRYMINNENWNLLFSIFRALDVIQHYFWHDKALILKFYKIFDNYIAELINKYVTKDVNLFIVSDHGFSRVDKYFCVNNWLKSIDMISIDNNHSQSIINLEMIKKMLLKVGLRDFVWKIKRNKMVESILKFIPSEEFGYVNKIKWDKTKAYYYEGSDGIINVNLRGREPIGTVSQNEYNKIVDYIVNKLNNIVDLDKNCKVVKIAYKKSDIFGINDRDLPDIFILMNDGYRAVAFNKIDGNSIFMPPVHGKAIRPADHHIDGVFVAYGDNISKIKIDREIRVWDVAPTILHIFGYYGKWMDGKPILDIFGNMNTGESVRIHNEKYKIISKIKKMKYKNKNVEH